MPDDPVIHRQECNSSANFAEALRGGATVTLLLLFAAAICGYFDERLGAMSSNDKAARSSDKAVVRDNERAGARPFDATRAAIADIASMKVCPGDWPQWGGSRLRNNTPTGRDVPIMWDVGDEEKLKPQKNIKWSVRLGNQTYGNPSVANGKVFIGSNNGGGYLKRFPSKVDLGTLLCFDEQTGRFLWQYSCPPALTGRANDWEYTGMPSTPVIDGDRVWAVTNRCEVICLDAEGFLDGKNDGPYREEQDSGIDEADVVWKFEMMRELRVLPHNKSNCSVITADGKLFVCTSNGVDEAHKYVPAPEAPSFICLDRQTGRLLWSDNTPGENIMHGQWASPSYAVLGAQPQVIFPGGDGWLYSFDPAGDGRGHSKLLWKFDCNPKESIYRVNRATRNPIIGFPVIYDGLVYVAVGEDPEHGEGDGHLWCIDPSGRPDGSDISPELVFNKQDPDRVIPYKRVQACVAKEGDFTRENANSGLVWHYSTVDYNRNGKIEFDEGFHRAIGSPTVRDNILYIADESGLFHCLDAKTGMRHWTYDLLASSWSSPLVVDGKVYMVDSDGDVAIFRHSADPAVAMKKSQNTLPQQVPSGSPDPNNGWAPIAEINMGTLIYSTPIVANDVLYIATFNRLYAIAADETPAKPK